MKFSVVTVSLFSRSVGVSLKKSVFGVGVFFKALCTANTDFFNNSSNKGDTLPSNTVTSTDLHLGGGGGMVTNKHSSGGGGGGHRNNTSEVCCIL